MCAQPQSHTLLPSHPITRSISAKIAEFLFTIIFIYVCVCLHLSASHICPHDHNGQKRWGTRAPGAGITCCYELPDMGDGNQSRVLWKSGIEVYPQPSQLSCYLGLLDFFWRMPVNSEKSSSTKRQWSWGSTGYAQNCTRRVVMGTKRQSMATLKWDTFPFTQSLFPKWA